MTESNRFLILSYLDTFITDGAVRATRRPVELASDTPLHPHCHTIDIHVLVKRSSEIVVFVFIWRCCVYK